ncbi:efflux RND transporter permease subunit [Candidatus Puniceispirillum marinum]|uniref:Acriflavin resistance protein D n=1 Tax=Puniceispirillum marinum (strain IMCC1322) TaxID=488538 RepID=D5BQ97_PUNMI|nr:efflux RND transporter permease subunit [Candidatus Puniceispirillum marinum]ADE38595.1 acriflavin resistance protein D [Candidatus Puniceispirillum marinum IMCC1322]
MGGLIKAAIERPVAVLALVLLAVLFGIVAIRDIPIQMSPDIEKPILEVRVNWPGASPEDIDREVVTRLEGELASLNGVEELQSRSSFGRTRITLTYNVKQDMDKALVLLLSRLSAVNDLPDDAQTPRVRTSNSDDSPIARLALVAKDDNEVNLETLGAFLETNIVDPLGRIEGVAEVGFNGGGRPEMRVIIDPDKLIQYKLTLTEVITALRSSSSMMSVGVITEGKRTYAVRTESENYTPDTAGRIVLRTDVSSSGTIVPILLSDVASVDLRVQKRTSFRRLNGKEAIIINALREQGTNVVTTMQRLREEIAVLNKTELSPRGLELNLVYDETKYIESAIDLVQQNIWIGGVLALFILLLFLRSLLPAAIIFAAIPVSIIGTFVAIAGLGLSINVISLAGLAFAVGMVVDASIVSLENIFRLRQRGMKAQNAAFLGARQVWAPILGSALTTVLVFVPILMLDLPVGQLFRDIAIAISVAVLISVVVSVTVIPALASRLLAGAGDKYERLFPIPGIDHAARFFSNLILRYVRVTVKRGYVGALVVVAILLSAGFASYRFAPQLDYLPDGNANFAFGRIIVPEGYSIDETLRIAEKMEAAARPLWEGNTEPGGPPAIERFFFVAYSGGAFAGASSVDPSRVSDLRMVLMRPIFDVPGARAFVRQASLFGRSVGGSRSIRVDISGNNRDDIMPIALALNNALEAKFTRREGNQLRAIPSLSSGAPQIRITPDLTALARAGVTVRELSAAVDIFNDGANVIEVPIEGELIDMVLSGKEAQNMSADALNTIPIVTRSGNIIRLEQLAKIDIVSAPGNINRLGGKQSLSLQLRPNESITLEDAVQQIETEILPKINDMARDAGVSISLRGAASAMDQTWKAMQSNVATAIVVIFLLMVILLRSFVMPLIILLAIPVAAAGGIGGLALLNLFVRQPLDMLTMLGFVILTGVVVNNAILLIEQTVLHLREEGMSPTDAILEATRNRIRPIFMSTLTSLFGLVPLVIFPGAGSELYRGIGVVVFGGLALSTLATLLIVPPLLGIALQTRLGRNTGQKIVIDV